MHKGTTLHDKANVAFYCLAKDLLQILMTSLQPVPANQWTQVSAHNQELLYCQEHPVALTSRDSARSSSIDWCAVVVIFAV